MYESESRDMIATRRKTKLDALQKVNWNVKSRAEMGLEFMEIMYRIQVDIILATSDRCL